MLPCAAMTAGREDLEEALGVPVVDGITAAIRMLERERTLPNTHRHKQVVELDGANHYRQGG